ncbi:S-adenosyl-L-methionine-dependent methyltransferase [Laetiporus sulphureus 93-53]|uniref:S-adenosyl-L-methionine-dependent methyltransferase n=1 Tax=Laetiporus sulphureus 93-53 TaxID=1314785 RepID=A0A165BHE6_9APHY|nr:S-adenosyl-L-methionine-dependent methyltransferase [Laetiporus sulphureus 93-53]KZT01060.1 S-adenosyl-L-methionine-dependent methyltransferase [Laetiporus sulphureus 93-53]
MDIKQIEALSSVISTSVAQLKELQASLKTTDHSASTARAEFLKPSLEVVAAASQLIALVRTPERYLMDMSTAHQISSSLRVVVETHVTEIIREKGKGAMKSLHIKEISAYNHVNYLKLGRVLRLLATHHIYEEVSPNVFANNSISIVMDTGKSLAELDAKPVEKYDGSNGIAALVGLFSDETMHNSVCIADILKNPETTNSFSPFDAPFSIAWPGTKNIKMYDWLNLPENLPRLKRFGMAMNGMNSMTPPDAILRGFNWSSLPEGSVVVDCGGGVGSVSLPIVQTCPQIHLVVQDTGPVVAEAPAFWQTKQPEALAQGRVSFQAHNFFEPQPAANSNVSVYLLRMIMHNWPDAECVQILKRLHQSSTKNTRIVIVDNIMLYASREQNVEGQDTGASDPEALAPEPLLANWGAANSLSYKQDINMLSNHNACERTLPEFADLLGQAGFRIVEVHQAHQSWLPQIVAVPV